VADALSVNLDRHLISYNPGNLEPLNAVRKRCNVDLPISRNLISAQFTPPDYLTPHKLRMSRIIGMIY
jgi:hypothetical protein